MGNYPPEGPDTPTYPPPPRMGVGVPRASGLLFHSNDSVLTKVGRFGVGYGGCIFSNFPLEYPTKILNYRKTPR